MPKLFFAQKTLSGFYTSDQFWGQDMAEFFIFVKVGNRPRRMLFLVIYYKHPYEVTAPKLFFAKKTVSGFYTSDQFWGQDMAEFVNFNNIRVVKINVFLVIY